jgi:hypothetical protein
MDNKYKVVRIGRPIINPVAKRKIHSVIDKYFPCEPKDELKNIAKVFVELNEPRQNIIMSELHFGFERATEAMEELEKLGIISKVENHQRKILVGLNEIDKIFKG